MASLLFKFKHLHLEAHLGAREESVIKRAVRACDSRSALYITYLSRPQAADRLRYG